MKNVHLLSKPLSQFDGTLFFVYISAHNINLLVERLRTSIIHICITLDMVHKSQKNNAPYMCWRVTAVGTKHMAVSCQLVDSVISEEENTTASFAL